jgi:GNAT superfamily N-acetyltransferase
MIFANTELAARIERAESRLVASAGLAVREARPAVSVMVRELGGGIATFAGPDSPFNKLAGVGFAGAIQESVLQEVEDFFRDQGASLQIEVSSLADPATFATLGERGYRLVGFENVLGQRLPATLPRAILPQRSDPDIDVTPTAPDELELWLATVTTAFAAADTQGVASHESFEREALETAIRDFARAGGICQYTARMPGGADRNAPVGGASLRIDEGIAQLCGAATLPEYRRRGVQSALLARRLADALAAGCDVAVVTTQPGSKSHENVQKLGFELLYTRAVLVGPSALGVD